MAPRPAWALALLLCLSLTSTACLVRRRVITRPGGSVRETLRVADRDALVARIAQIYASLQDLSATVDMTPALGSAERSRITEYKDVRGYILFRKPADIRIIGLYPVVRNKAFDMVSTGSEFKLHVPTLNRFITGPAEVITPSANKLENLRPQHFLEALLVRPVDPTRETPALVNLTDEDQANYILVLIDQAGGEPARVARSIWFDRVRLTLARQLVFDASGNILTDARYSGWQDWGGVSFPKQIQINRPQDEYAVVISIVKMEVNHGITDDKFILEQPPGTNLRVIGQAKGAASPSRTGKGTQ